MFGNISYLLSMSVKPQSQIISLSSEDLDV